MLLVLAMCWTLLSVVCLLWCEHARWRTGIWLSKPLASFGFVALAGLGGAWSSPYGQIMLGALLFCALGDVLLIPSGRTVAFLAGLSCFALGHAAYATAFWLRLPVVPVVLMAALCMSVVAGATLRWLRPHLPRDLVWPVRSYILVISLMVALAAGASWSTGDARIVVGALAFTASDLSVARDRFVKPGFDNLAWGLPLYYAAQLTLAWTAARP